MIIKNIFNGKIILENDLADLSGADLREANLREANLRGADLSGANLFGADLFGADLRGADLCGANLCGADLCEANLFGADLCGANLSAVDLCGANLRGADLCGANLFGANLFGADLCGADLRGANLPIYQLCPEGNLIVYKKASGMIVQLELLKDVKRTSSLVGRKCRAESAIVKAIYNPDRTISDLKEVTGDYNSSILYKVGETVLPDKYNDDIRVECTNGIHFFITFEEARDC